MGLKTFTIDFAEYTKHQYLRFDEKFWHTTKNIAVYDFILLKNVFNLVNGNSYTEYYTEEKTDIPYIRIGDLTVRFEIDDKNIIYLDDSIELNEDKILKEDDLILATIGATIGKINLARDFKGGTFSNNTILLRLKDKKNHNSYFYEKLLQTNLLQKYIWGVVSQKAQPNLQTYDLENVKIPLIPKSKQDQIVSQIEPIEKKIKELKAQITPPQEVINKVFAREFGFDLENADEKKKNMIHYSSLIDVANEELKFDISLKYRFIFNKYVKNPSKNDWIELGKIVEVKGGKRLPKGQNITEEDTGFKYVRVDDLSWSGIFDLENIKYISEENHKKIKNYISKENDILLTIVGATVGKCGLVPLELDGENITENFARLIILDKEKYLPEYINYCLQSKTSVYQIDEYKGRSSQGKLALFRIKKIKIPNIKSELQQKIVDEIKAELDKQEEIKSKIESERNKIDEIIEKAIKI